MNSQSSKIDSLFTQLEEKIMAKKKLPEKKKVNELKLLQAKVTEKTFRKMKKIQYQERISFRAWLIQMIEEY